MVLPPVRALPPPCARPNPLPPSATGEKCLRTEDPCLSRMRRPVPHHAFPAHVAHPLERRRPARVANVAGARTIGPAGPPAPDTLGRNAFGLCRARHRYSARHPPRAGAPRGGVRRDGRPRAPSCPGGLRAKARGGCRTLRRRHAPSRPGDGEIQMTDLLFPTIPLIRSRERAAACTLPIDMRRPGRYSNADRTVHARRGATFSGHLRRLRDTGTPTAPPSTSSPGAPVRATPRPAQSGGPGPRPPATPVAGRPPGRHAR